MPDLAEFHFSHMGDARRRNRTDPAVLLALIQRMKIASATDAYTKPPVALPQRPIARTG